jgi:hypothetical protein
MKSKSKQIINMCFTRGIVKSSSHLVFLKIMMLIFRLDKFIALNTMWGCIFKIITRKQLVLIDK